MTVAQNIYDNQIFFDGYKKLRENPYSANILEEKPALYAIAPDLHGKRVLDLGCGNGENCAEFCALGASYVLGVDISEKMLTVAREEHPDIAFLRADMNDLSCIDERFDVVFSSLAVHYIEDFARMAKEVSCLLADGGYFIFSQEHPLTTAPLAGASWTKDAEGNALHYNLTDYTKSGKRTTSWFVDGVIKYHRTFSDIVCALADAGLMIETMQEPTPTQETITRDPKWEKCLHKPNFLLIRARKL